MLEEGRLGLSQAVMLMVTTMTIWGHLIMVGVTFTQAGRDAWLSGLLGGVFALVAVAIASLWAIRWPNQTLIAVLKGRLGWFSPVLTIPYLFFFWLKAGTVARMFADTYTLMLPETPATALTFLLVLVSCYALATGLEPTARAVQILLVVMGVSAIGVVAASLKDQDYRQLLPLLEHGPLPVLRGAITVMAWLADLTIVTMLHPAIRTGRSPWVLNLMVLALTVVMLLGPLIGPIAVFGPEEAGRLIFPTFEQIRYINLGTVLRHLDAIALFWWTAGLVVRMAVYHYVLVQALAQVCGLKEHKCLIVPVGVLIALGSASVSGNQIEMRAYLQHGYPLFNLAMGLGLPGLFLLVAMLCGWRERPRQASRQGAAR